MTASTAKTIELAAALAEELGNLPSGGLPAKRVYVAPLDQAEGAFETLTVLVMGKSDKREVGTRVDNMEEHQVDVAVIKRVEGNDVEKVDGLMLVAERIKNLYADEENADTPDAGYLREKPLADCTWAGLEHDPIYSPVRLAKNVFLSVITLTYQHVR
jgi:hypothetical protein